MKPISCRRSAIQAGNRAGMLAGMMSRGGERMSRERARQIAGDISVPQRWRVLYMRAFVKSALFAAHTHRAITQNSKYGVA